MLLNKAQPTYITVDNTSFSMFAVATPVAKGLNFIKLSVSLTYDGKHLRLSKLLKQSSKPERRPPKEPSWFY